TISRTYRSAITATAGYFSIYGSPYGLGDLWRFNFQWELDLDREGFPYRGTFAVVAPDGSKYAFTLATNGTVTPQNFGVSDISVQYLGGSSVNYNSILSGGGGPFLITTSSGDQILVGLFKPYYSSFYLQGHATQITYRGGYVWSLVYGSANQLQSI